MVCQNDNLWVVKARQEALGVQSIRLECPRLRAVVGEGKCARVVDDDDVIGLAVRVEEVNQRTGLFDRRKSTQRPPGNAGSPPHRKSDESSRGQAPGKSPVYGRKDVTPTSARRG